MENNTPSTAVACNTISPGGIPRSSTITKDCSGWHTECAGAVQRGKINGFKLQGWQVYSGTGVTSLLSCLDNICKEVSRYGDNFVCLSSPSSPDSLPLKTTIPVEGESNTRVWWWYELRGQLGAYKCFARNIGAAIFRIPGHVSVPPLTCVIHLCYCFPTINSELTPQNIRLFLLYFALDTNTAYI